MALQEFERRLERLVEGAFAKVFRSRLAPLEIARRLTREMDANRTVGVRGLLAPNRFTVQLGPDDHEQFSQASGVLVEEWAAYAREHGKQEGYTFVGPVEVVLELDPGLDRGMFRVKGEMVEGEGGPAATLVLADGSRVRCGDEPVSIGRHPDNDVVLPDPEVSRHHAEVRRAEGGFVIVDLGSMNGTRVNGAGVKERRLDDGDQVAIGGNTFRFETA